MSTSLLLSVVGALAPVLFRAEPAPRAISAPRAIGETPLVQATKAFEAGRYARVLEITGKVAASDADWPRARYLAGETQLLIGRPADAEKSFGDVLSKRPKAVPAQVGLARALMLTGHGEDAEILLREAVQSDPNDAGARLAFAELLGRAGKHDDARKELAAAQKLDPKSALVARVSIELALRAENAAEALRQSDAFLQANPKHPMGYFLKGVALEKNGQDKDAIVQYEKALEMDAAYLDAHKNLAILCHTLSDSYQDQERTKKAFEHYERYFALGGADEDLKRMHENLLKFKDQLLKG